MDRQPLPTWPAVVQAHHVLYGRAPSLRELAALDPIALKKTYRERAAACHPDRSASTGGGEAKLQEEFVLVGQAYQLLLQWIQEWARNCAAGPLPAVGMTFGTMPRFSDHLLQVGLVDRQTLQLALMLQKLERPRFGDLCVAWGAVTPHAMTQVLAGRLPQEPVASAAVRMGALPYGAAHQILVAQGRCQRPVGEILVAVGALKPRELKKSLRQYQKLVQKHMSRTAA